MRLKGYKRSYIGKIGKIRAKWIFYTFCAVCVAHAICTVHRSPTSAMGPSFLSFQKLQELSIII